MSDYEQRFKYHRHLRNIALADVEYLQKKDRSYGASWKESGRSAWFMMRRMIDRLANMMRRPDAPTMFNLENVDNAIAVLERDQRDPVRFAGTNAAMAVHFKHLRDSYLSEDVLARVQAEGLDGPDGSVIAVIRDLRRYCLLVEAEITERLATRKDAVEWSPEEELYSERECDRLFPFAVNKSPGLDAWYQRRSDRWYLRPAVSGVKDVPGKLRALYKSVSFGNDNYFFLLEIGKCPSEIRDVYPKLREECNMAERALLDDWQQTLYEWIEDEGKWRVMSIHKDWTR